jgi:hypothetical protein
MKGLQKVTRVQLKINHTDEFFLLGIVSSEADYKLSQILNKKFNISLKNVSPLKINDITGLESVFSRFSDSDSSSEVTFNLTSNRSGSNYLLKKLKNVDYIFHIQDPENETNVNSIAATLKEIDSVTAIFKIDVKEIKDKNLQYLTH